MNKKIQKIEPFLLFSLLFFNSILWAVWFGARRFEAVIVAFSVAIVATFLLEDA